MKAGLGEAVVRAEDDRLLSGRGRYTDDHVLPGEARAVVLRSPHAAAEILRIDIGAVAALPGVLLVLTGKDILAAGQGSAASMADYKRPDGSPMFKAARRPLVVDGRVRFVGDPVAFVVAESLEIARAAAEAIVVDYEPLAAVIDPLDALKPGPPQSGMNAPTTSRSVSRRAIGTRSRRPSLARTTSRVLTW